MRTSKQERCLDLDRTFGWSAGLARGESNISVSRNLSTYTIVDFDRFRHSRQTHETRGNTGGIDIQRAATGAGPDVARCTAMSFAAVVDRVRLDFLEMPEMELTLPQAVRLWSLGMDDCRYVIDSLVDAGFLAWTARRTIVRKGRGFVGRQDTDSANITVLVSRTHNKSVTNG